MKVLAEKDGKDPGFTAFGPEAGEVVAVVQAAMATGLGDFFAGVPRDFTRLRPPASVRAVPGYVPTTCAYRTSTCTRF